MPHETTRILDHLRISKPWRLWLVASVVAIVSSSAVIIYATQVRRSALALISSAGRIQTPSDAQRELGTLRRSRIYSAEEYVKDENQGYRFEMSNGLLSTLRLVPHTGVLLQITMKSGRLEGVLLGMFTDKSSVWAQEDFLASPGDLHVSTQSDRTGRESKALLMLPSMMPAIKRQQAFAFNSNCLVKPGGCSSAQEILPTLSQQAAPDANRND